MAGAGFKVWSTGDLPIGESQVWSTQLTFGVLGEDFVDSTNINCYLGLGFVHNIV